VIMERKRETRRQWAVSHAQKFRANQVVDFWNKNPRNGGQKMGSIILAKGPYRENTSKLVFPQDYEAEGFAFMEERGQEIQGMPPLIFFQQWKVKKLLLFVVEFKLYLLSEAGMRRKLQLQEESSEEK